MAAILYDITILEEMEGKEQEKEIRRVRDLSEAMVGIGIILPSWRRWNGHPFKGRSSRERNQKGQIIYMMTNVIGRRSI
jgi:hypothetical protein